METLIKITGSLVISTISLALIALILVVIVTIVKDTDIFNRWRWVQRKKLYQIKKAFGKVITDLMVQDMKMSTQLHTEGWKICINITIQKILMTMESQKKRG